MGGRIARLVALPRSAWLLVAANIVPLVGVTLLGWDLGAVMLLFWSENLVVGGYHIARMAMVTGRFALFLVPFFTFHFGAFTFAHGLFVFGFFVADDFQVFAPGELRGVLATVALGTLALVASHGASFVTNFVRGGEMARMREAVASLRFRKMGPGTWTADVDPALTERRVGAFHELGTLMGVPYRRLAVLHVTLIAAGFFVAFVGSSLPALALLVLLKTGADLRAHLRERKRWGRETIERPAASADIPAVDRAS